MLEVAWTGIAASLLTNGKTIHMTFHLPLDINESTTCNNATNSVEGRAIMNTKILIWDEISMASKLAFNAVDKLFRDLLKVFDLQD